MQIGRYPCVLVNSKSCDMYDSFTCVASNIYIIIIIIIIIKGTFFQTFLWGVGIWHAPSMKFVSGWQHYTLILSLSAGLAQKNDHINRGPKLNDMQLTCFPLGSPVIYSNRFNNLPPCRYKF